MMWLCFKLTAVWTSAQTFGKGKPTARAAIFVQLENALAIAGNIGLQLAHDLLADIPQSFGAFRLGLVGYRPNIVRAISAIAASKDAFADFFGCQDFAAKQVVPRVSCAVAAMRVAFFEVCSHQNNSI
jgi:hypothetical protein